MPPPKQMLSFLYNQFGSSLHLSLLIPMAKNHPENRLLKMRVTFISLYLLASTKLMKKENCILEYIISFTPKVLKFQCDQEIKNTLEKKQKTEFKL